MRLVLLAGAAAVLSLIAADAALVRQRPALPLLERALLEGQRERPDLVLISGDLCQAKSWGDYVRLGRLLDRQLKPSAYCPAFTITHFC